MKPPVLLDSLVYQVAGWIRADHRKTLRGCENQVFTDGFLGMRNRSVRILKDGTDCAADGTLQIR